MFNVNFQVEIKNEKKYQKYVLVHHHVTIRYPTAMNIRDECKNNLSSFVVSDLLSELKLVS